MQYKIDGEAINDGNDLFCLADPDSVEVFFECNGILFLCNNEL